MTRINPTSQWKRFSNGFEIFKLYLMAADFQLVTFQKKIIIIVTVRAKFLKISQISV